MSRPAASGWGAAAAAVAAAVALGAAVGSTAAVRPAAAGPAAGIATARAAVLRAADLPGRWAADDPSTLVFLTALTGQDACDPSLTGLQIAGQADSAVFASGPLDAQARVTVYADAGQAGEALVREARSQSARCVRLRVSRLGFALRKLQVQDVPSLGVGAVRFRATLLLPSRPKAPVTADLVLAVKGRGVVRLWVVGVGEAQALGAAPAVAAKLLGRLPAA